MSRWRAFWSRPVGADELRDRAVWVFGTALAALTGALTGAPVAFGRACLMFMVSLSLMTAYRLYMSGRAQKKVEDNSDG